MARTPLTETQLKAIRPAERIKKLSDAHSGLYLVVHPNGGRWWRVRVTRDGRERHVSLGTYPEVGLDQARARAAQVRLTKKNGDPAALAAELRGAERPHPVRVAPAGDSIESVVERWRIWTKDKKLAPSTVVRNDRVLGYLLRELGPYTPMGAIDTPTLQDAIWRIERAHGPEFPRRALRLANVLWRYAMSHRIVSGVNPASGLKANEFLTPHKKQSFAAITEQVPALPRGESLRVHHLFVRPALSGQSVLNHSRDGAGDIRCLSPAAFPDKRAARLFVKPFGIACQQLPPAIDDAPDSGSRVVHVACRLEHTERPAASMSVTKMWKVC